jgi:hypothetical protein
MPSTSEKQARFMAAEYGRAKEGESTRTGMGAKKLKEWVLSDARKEMLKKKAGG